MKKSYFWVDFLKSLAAFAVIILHVSVPFAGHIEKAEWFAGNFYDSLTRFCVPIFVMVSGVLLLGKSEKLSVFLQKRFLRLLLPFAFWSVIYLALKINYNLSTSEILSFSIRLFKEGAEYHLWYIYMIIGLYLLVPILNKWILNSTKIELIYFLSIWLFVILLSLPIINKFFTRIDFRYFSGYIGYLILGYFLYHFVHLKKRFAFTIFVLAVLCTYVATYYLSLKSGTFAKKYYEYLSINVVLASVGIFMVCKDIMVKNQWVQKSIAFISKYSYGIYLSHVFVLLLLTKIGFGSQFLNIWFAIPYTAMVCFALSLLLTFLLSKIPFFGKYISG
jgi:surface polysaccharide O-acyltransferase-like enzyme